jgi:hypothetical protein
MRIIFGILAVIGGWVVLSLVFAVITVVLKGANRRQAPPTDERFTNLLTEIDNAYFDRTVLHEGRTPTAEEMPSYKYSHREKD